VYWWYIHIQGPLGILWTKLACVFCESITREPCKWAVLCSHCRTWSQRSLCLAAGRRLSSVCPAVWRYGPKEQLILSSSRTAGMNNLSEPGIFDGSPSKFCNIFMQTYRKRAAWCMFLQQWHLNEAGVASGEFCRGPELFWLWLECDSNFCFCDVQLLLILFGLFFGPLFLVWHTGCNQNPSKCLQAVVLSEIVLMMFLNKDVGKIVEIDFDVFSLC